MSDWKLTEKVWNEEIGNFIKFEFEGGDGPFGSHTTKRLRIPASLSDNKALEIAAEITGGAYYNGPGRAFQDFAGIERAGRQKVITLIRGIDC